MACPTPSPQNRIHHTGGKTGPRTLNGVQTMPANFSRAIRSTATVLVLVAVVGCGNRNEPVKVAGTVTVDGTPLEYGIVNFLRPESKAAAAGGSIQDGKFALAVPPGSYRVTITGTRKVAGKVEKSEMGDEAAVEPVVPTKYSQDSPLTAEVTGDGKELTFALEGIKPNPKSKQKR
jgi:hypothetical protein